MTRQINRLNTGLVAALVHRAGGGKLRPDEDYGRHADGGNLYLVVKENGGLGWSFLYRWRGKAVEIGLGSARDVSLWGGGRTKCGHKCRVKDAFTRRAAALTNAQPMAS